MSTITFEKALSVQAEQLAVWKTKLNNDCYNALEAFLMASNEGVVNPDHIKRGVDMGEYIANYKPLLPGEIEPLVTTPFEGKLMFSSPINKENSFGAWNLSEDAESEINFTIRTDGSGWFEWEVAELEEYEEGSLTFEANVLVDYDGVFELPLQLVEYLEKLGYNMDYCQ